VLALGSIVFRLALVAVNSHGIVLTVLANTTTIVVSVNVQGQSLAVHFLIVLALVAVTMTVAG